MLHPRTAPKIYRQNDTWHVRVYVPKPVVHLVGNREIHRSTDETNRAAALKVAEKKRSDLYVWFNEWSCPAYVPVSELIYAAFRSKAKGLFPPSDEWRRRGL
ncbi:DUF6538 domain-containing protein [Halocynthiibacter namhaensis]|uniref:DUF6538 domain-containing protein n=1 Tax=Halocynthiibacter namhaensis TaxID=1290553 RepID=UPI003B51008C